MAKKTTPKTLTATTYSTTEKLGIVGGGQLARMLAVEAQQLGFEVRILSEKKTDPAAQVAQAWVCGTGHSNKDIQDFSQGLDHITFESEFFPMQAFTKLVANKKSTERPPNIFPAPSVMHLLQDRSTQKNLLVKNKIPTAAYIDVRQREDLERAIQKFPGGFVLKKCRGGYDGNGTFYYREASDLTRLQSLLPGEFIAEELVPFKRELAVVMARSSNDEIVSFPLVQTLQKDSRCDHVIGPIRSPKINPLLTRLKKFLRAINYVGAIGFELFDTGSTLVVNEIAPRVHNSGHFTQDACFESQFLLHLKAGLGFPLQVPVLRAPAFCMVNLLGRTDVEVGLAKALSGHLHWYGKSENRPGRKLGHVNYVGKNQAALLKQALNERKACQL